MIRVVSLFAGLGGFDMGLYRAAEALGLAVEVVAAYDTMPCAVKAYNANQRHPVAEVRDLKTMERADLPPHDLVIGGPPCQPFSLAGKRAGHGDERNCLPDFLRLAGDAPYVMENVVSRLINAPWSERLNAKDFGDVTKRKRWFYSNYLLHVIPTPGPRRIRDIRDHAEDARILAKRAGCKAGNHSHFDDTLDTLDTLAAHSWHGHDIRGSGKLIAIVEHSHGEARPSPDDGFLRSFTGESHHRGNKTAATLKIGLRGNSASASASAFEDDEILGSVLSNSFHANEASKLVVCRNPSLLEMARAHSIPDTFDWCGATKTQRGQMIANSIPIGLATGVCRAILDALTKESTMTLEYAMERVRG